MLLPLNMEVKHIGPQDTACGGRTLSHTAAYPFTKVEVADGVFATCALSGKQQAGAEAAVESGRPDLASMTAMLSARWKQGKTSVAEPAKAGQIRTFRVAALDASAKRIELELLS